MIEFLDFSALTQYDSKELKKRVESVAYVYINFGFDIYLFYQFGFAGFSVRFCLAGDAGADERSGVLCRHRLHDYLLKYDYLQLDE